MSGKGTSAALYMAELKGVVLALSQQHTSPRALLIEANRIISRHLDTRSFITITYAVVDIAARTLTYARAGHCPLIYVPGPYGGPDGAQILTEGGIVLGLQLDTGDLFAQLLPETTIPLGPGDLFLFYTDGLSEAMNPDGDCFGDERLGRRRAAARAPAVRGTARAYPRRNPALRRHGPAARRHDPAAVRVCSTIGDCGCATGEP